MFLVHQVLILFALTTYSRPIPKNLQMQRRDQILAETYLTKFGYLSQSSTSSGQTSSFQSTDKAITRFQAFAGLKQTGDLNAETIEFMKKKRCGVRDFGDTDNELQNKTGLIINTRHKRYALQGSRWRPRNLTYRVTKYPTEKGLTRNDVDQTMKKAFDVWEQATNLEFERRSSGDVNIELRFEKRYHGDDDPFDGEGGTLAHAYFPIYGGDVHFDDEEDWTVNSYRGTSLLMTAAHELGHSLGLSHSYVRRSLMAPFYRGYEQDVKLDRDDIRGIQRLYGEKISDSSRTTTRTTTSTTRPRVSRVTFFPRTRKPPLDIDKSSTSTTRPRVNQVTFFPRTIRRFTTPTISKHVDNKELCSSNRVDTMVTVKNGDTYAFLGRNYWKLRQNTVEPGYPRLISKGWKGLPSNLDAAFTWTNGSTYFFKGSQYWRFPDVSVMDKDYPKNIGNGFQGVPANIDATMVSSDGGIYFFKRSQYWLRYPDKKPSLSNYYPRLIQNWEGIPSNLDAALNYSNGKKYFFKNGKYYRFDEKKKAVEENVLTKYPRDTGVWWFGCKKGSAPLTKE